MTLFTIDKITEKAVPPAAASAHRARRFQPYHPCPTVADHARFPRCLEDLSGTLMAPVAAGRLDDRHGGLNSTGASPSSPGGYSIESSDGSTLSPDSGPTKAVEKSKSKTDEDKKPPHSYIALIAMAILASEEKRLLLCDIYQFIQENYPYYRNNDRSWRNSVRHNLSLNECFIKHGRSGDGRGNFWAIHPANLDDFSRGDFHRRRARRRVRASDLMVHGYPVYHHPYAAGHAAAYPIPVAATPLGFVPMTMTTLPPYPLPPTVYPPTVYPPSTQYPPLGYPSVPTVSPLPVPPVRPSATPSSSHIDRYSPVAETATRDRVSPAAYRLSLTAITPPLSSSPPRPCYPYSAAQSRSPYSLPITTLPSPFTTLPSSQSPQYLHRYPPATIGLPYSTSHVTHVTNSMSSYHGNTISSMPLYLH